MFAVKQYPRSINYSTYSCGNKNDLVVKFLNLFHVVFITACISTDVSLYSFKIFFFIDTGQIMDVN